MSVYVDPLRVWGGANAPRCFRFKSSCHMYADSLDELHAMAQEVGLRREWFQGKQLLAHYDLVPTKRATAVRLGAMEHSFAEMWAFVQAQSERGQKARAEGER